MGQINQGILGGFSGKVGTVIGTRSRGKSFMRGLPQSFRDANSDGQRATRVRFRLLGHLTAAFARAARLGFRHEAVKNGAMTNNRFFSANWGATSGDTEGAEVDYSALKVSDGELAPVKFGEAQFGEQLEVSATFQPYRNMELSDDADNVYLFAYNPTWNQGVLSSGAKRSSRSVSLELPGTWAGQEVHLYGFVAGKGSKTSGLYSASAYIGKGEVNA